MGGVFGGRGLNGAVRDTDGAGRGAVIDKILVHEKTCIVNTRGASHTASTPGTLVIIYAWPVLCLTVYR